MFQGTGNSLGGGSPRPSAPPPPSQSSSSGYYRDPIFAILFLVQLSLVVVAAVALGPSALQKDQQQSINNSNSNIPFRFDQVLWFLTATLASSLTSSLVCFWILRRYAQISVQLAFLAAPVTSALLATIATYTTGFRIEIWYGVLGVSLLTAGVYVFTARRYVPFAASTLTVALEALSDHAALFGLALLTGILVYAWFVLWSVAALGLYQWFQDAPHKDRRVPCPDAPHRLCDAGYDQQPLYATGMMLLSLFWTTQVLQNILHTTTGGTLAAWWGSRGNNNSNSSTRGSITRDALVRSCTLSLGSICLGSLVVALLQTLEQIMNMAKNKKNTNGRRHQDRPQENSMAQWLLQWVRKITDYMNSWAFVYVGVYGYDYMTAGKTVAGLVTQRGWSTFVADRLVYRVLGLAKISMALLSGALTTLVFVTSSNNSEWVWEVFGAGTVVGYLLASSALFVVESAVRTVILCFAENPRDLERNHPLLHTKLHRGWSTAYPEAWAHQTKQDFSR